jgi:probable phosphoglycerate mutase
MIEDDKEIKIYVIRHGEAGKSWSEDLDPGLSVKGSEQSEELIQKLSADYENTKFKIFSSPLLRAQETAIPLQKRFGFNIEIDKTFAEMPSPGVPLAERSAWLKNIFDAKVDELETPQIEWRKEIISKISAIKEDTIIFSHFMVINTIVGWLKNFDETVNFYPANCSITKLSKRGKEISLAERGQELTTFVN